MTKLQVKNNIYCYEFSSTTNVYTICIILYTRKKHIFKTIFTSDHVLNIQDDIGKVFGYIERESYMGLNDSFSPRRINIPHATPNYGPGKSKFEIDYYIQTYCFTGKLAYM